MAERWPWVREEKKNKKQTKSTLGIHCKLRVGMTRVDSFVTASGRRQLVLLLLLFHLIEVY